MIFCFCIQDHFVYKIPYYILLSKLAYRFPKCLILGISIGVCLRLVYAAINMVWWCIDRIDLKGFGSCVRNVMTHARGNDNTIPCSRVTYHAIKYHLGKASLDKEELFNMGVYFFADFSCRRDMHNNELCFYPRMNHGAERFVFLCARMDVGDDTHTFSIHPIQNPVPSGTGWNITSL